MQNLPIPSGNWTETSELLASSATFEQVFRGYLHLYSHKLYRVFQIILSGHSIL